MQDMRADEVREAVRRAYASVATQERGCCATSASCCDSAAALPGPGISRALGYDEKDLASVPEGANMGLGCGNPQAIAGLSEGQTVVDLGSGGGFDCFLAAKQIGASGRVIGVDMTPEMISKARRLAHEGGYSNVEFRLGEIEHLPVADDQADVVMSNCVINLSPDKRSVYSEAFRVLKPGGRIAISDVVALAPVPQDVRDDLEAYTGCIAGALEVEELAAILSDVGFADVAIDVNEQSRYFIAEWAPGTGLQDLVAAASITAKKPSA